MQKNVRLIKKPRLTNQVLIVAWPGMGEVAFKAASYLIEKLKAEAFAYLDSADYFFPTSSIIKNGQLNTKELPQNRFYYWRNPNIKSGPKMAGNDLIIFLSNTQPDLAKSADYTDSILEVARLYKVKLIIGFAAMPVPIDHTQTPGVWLAVTHKELLRHLQRYNIKILSQAAEVSGMNGLFLGLAKRQGFAGFCLLGEIPIYTIQIENPKAILAILERLKRILNLPLDLRGLQKQVEFIETEINKLINYLKEGAGLSGGLGPISEAEIEKIKKALTQLTSLPQSIKQKIDKLFDSAKNDISKANELKQELDKWNVYKEYEDRFLDLFKKSGEKGN